MNEILIFPSEYSIVLRDLYINKQYIDIYTYHTRYNLLPHQIAQCIILLIKKNIITKEGNKITITDYGRKWVLANRRVLFLSQRCQYWKTTRNKGYKDFGDNNNEIRLPNISKIDKSLFTTNKKGG